MLALVPGVSRSGATIVGGMLVGLDRPTAAEFSFFLAMPTMAAAFAHSLLELRHQITADRTVGTGDRVRHGVRGVRSWSSSRFWPWSAGGALRPFAWYRIVAGVVLLRRGGDRLDTLMLSVAAPQLHRRLLRHGPAVHHVAAFIWIFGVVDGLTSPFYERLLGRQVPGLGILTTAVGVLLVGAIATNVIGKRILQRARAICCACRCFARSTPR